MPRKRRQIDPYTAGLRSYSHGRPFDPDFGLKCQGWGAITAQYLYETGRLKAASRSAAISSAPKRVKG